MYKIFFDESSYNYLKEWSEQYKRFVIDCPAVAPKFQIICKTEHLSDEITLYVSTTKYGYKFNFSLKKKLVAKGKIIRTPNGKHDFDIQFDLSEYAEKEYLTEEFDGKDKVMNTVLPYFIQLYCNSFLMANAFLMYGNIVDDKDIIAQGRNSGIDKIIVFRPYKETLYAVPVNYHKSPEGVFPVRGHLRHYKKTGKVIWIEGYLKGTDKEEK